MIQLVGMLDSPYVRRVAVALLSADIPFVHRPISLFRHIDAFAALSPLLKAPSLVLDDGTALVDSNVILEYLAASHPKLAALTLSRAADPAKAAWALGVGLTVAEKAVQVHYERALRTKEQQNADWKTRIGGQLAAGLAALEAAAPAQGGIAGESLGLADITVVCAWGFTQTVIGDVTELVDSSRYPQLAAYAARAEALPAFRAAPPVDGVVAPIG